MRKQEYIERYGEEAWEKRRASGAERSKRRRDYFRTYREEHKEECKKQKEEYHSTPFGRATYLLGGYRMQDKEAGRGETTITSDWIVDNIFTSTCTYCGETDWTKLGADRIDNEKAHTPDNCICACSKCNSGRGDRYSVEEFSILKRLTLK